ncbi:histidine kinase [Aquimarina sp. 2201CG5-10]|uniref:sensor histidine kinase n=1 Tax=Aquimarina callyspongiae TaxID=3098150 RepID=UPI002AB396C8|nr:histidine kinase [Aquimarina sp. 2201CG5-10]MDY8137864.1 histidine kinase [Aquimarina sp. 2201CG5-10]
MFYNKIFILFFFFKTVILFGQHPSYNHLTEKDGLPDVEFYDIIEDSEGFIWLAANKGLYRYDGKSFKNYSNSKKRGLSVFGLKFDHKGRLWCNNISGQFFYVENDSLRLFTDLKKQSNGQLLSYHFFNEKIIVRTGYSLLEIDVEDKTQKVFFSNERYLSETQIKGDTTFFESQGTLMARRLHNIKIDTIASFERGKHGNVVIFKISDDDLLLQSIHIEHGIRDYYLRKGDQFFQLTKEKFPLKSRAVKCFVEDDKLWFCTKQGVELYHYQNKKFTYITTYFKGEEITEIIKDQNQNYWFTSLRSGVFVVPNIEVLRYPFKKEDSNITTFEKLNDSTLIAGTTKGNLFLVDKNSEHIKKFAVSKNNKVNKIAPIDDKHLLISLNRKGFILNKKSLKRDYTNNFKISYNGAKDLSFIEEGKLMFGGYASVEILDFKKKINTRIGFRRSYTTHYNKNTKEIYAGYVDGVESYDQSLKPQVITFNNAPIFALDIDNTQDNTIWISTFKDGIIKVKDGKAIRNYTVKDGLLSNQTGVIKSDGSFLWIVTDKGIQRLNTQTEEFENLTQKDGILSFNVSDIVVIDNEVYLGSNKGLFKFNKNKVFKENRLPDVYLTDIEVNDLSVPISDSYEFSSDENRIKISFHANGYLSDKDVSYFYTLSQDEDKWYPVSKGVNEVVFNNLSPNQYEFRLKAKMDNGIEETLPKIVKIKINTPFYKRWWFVLSVILCLGFVFWYYFTNRIRKLQEKQQVLIEKERLQQEMVSSKLKSLQSQMNPHFVFNAMNSIQNLVLKNDKQAAYTYLTKFASLMRDNLHMSEKSFVYFDQEVSHLKKYLELEKLRFRDDFMYEIEGEETIDDIKIPSTIIQPFAENALKHGLLHKKEGVKKMHIHFSLEKEVLCCVITDNGVGIEKSKEIDLSQKVPSNSFSTRAIKEKLALFKKYYKADIGFYYLPVDEGTSVMIKIPTLSENNFG